MIIEYNRPHSLIEALQLLRRPEPMTIPLGGGSAIRREAPEPVAVVDLQTLDLKGIHAQGKHLEIGALVTLQAWLDTPDLLPALRKAILHEATHNLRQVATLAGTLVAGGGRSPLTSALLALDPQLEIKSLASDGESIDTATIGLGDLLPQRKEYLKGKLITALRIPTRVRLAYEYVARTPADQPIVCVVVGRWPAGRTRLVLGGYGEAPLMAFDGPTSDGVELVARSAYSEAGDEWASAEYRQDVAATLTKRCIVELSNN